MAKKLIVGADGSQSYVDTTPAEDAQATLDAQAVTAAQQAAQAEVTRRTGFAANTNVQALLVQASTATDSQIDTWLTNNVTTLAQARTVLGALIKIVAAKLA